MQLSLNSRLTIALLAGIVGLVWQCLILTFGGVPSDAIVTACSGIIIATLAAGVTKENGSDSNKDADDKGK